MFCEEFTRRMNERRMEVSSGLAAARAELKRIEREIDRLVRHIAEGHGDGRAIGRRIAELEKRQDELQARLASSEEPPPVLHPSMAVVYRERVAALCSATINLRIRIASSRNAPERAEHCLTRMLPSPRHFVNQRPIRSLRWRPCKTRFPVRSAILLSRPDLALPEPRRATEGMGGAEPPGAMRSALFRASMARMARMASTGPSPK